MPAINNSKPKTQCSFSVFNLVTVGVLYMAASYFRFPTVHLKYQNSYTISLWLYLIASVCFIIVTLGQFLDSCQDYDQQGDKNKYRQKNMNGLMFVVSSGLLTGFAMFLPIFKSESVGYICLNLSSAILIILQLYKIISFVSQVNSITSYFNILKPKFYNLASQVCLLGTGVIFLVAFLEDSSNIQRKKLLATQLLSVGGFLMYISKIVLLCGTFINDKHYSQSIAISESQQKTQELEMQQLN